MEREEEGETGVTQRKCGEENGTAKCLLAGPAICRFILWETRSLMRSKVCRPADFSRLEGRERERTREEREGVSGLNAPAMLIETAHEFLERRAELNIASRAAPEVS